jgi:hypothetical protein
MKPWFRLLLGAVAACAVAGSLQAAPELSITGVKVDPASVKPGEAVTISVTVTNSGATGLDPGTGTAIAVPADTWPAGSTATFNLVFTQITTGYSFSYAGAGGVVSAAVQGAGGTGTVDINTNVPSRFTEAGAYRVSVEYVAHTDTNGGTFPGTYFATSSTALTVTGVPDLQVTALTYTASTSYVGGSVIPMTVRYRNNISSNGVNNVPFVPSTAATFFRIQVVLSSNPVYGDADDFMLTFIDRSTKLDADSVDQVFTWNQVLPGNFSGSYYVLAKIDSLNAVEEAIENDLTRNGNNIWQDLAATRIAIQPSTFPTVYLASATGTTGTSPSGNGYSDNPSLTSDGRYTVYVSDATNLVLGDTNGVRDIFLFDSQTSLVRRLNVSQQGAQANGNSNHPSISGNGRQVAFSSDATNLVIGDVNGFTDIFIVDTLTGAISMQTVSVAGVQANGSSFRPMLSHSGRYLVFESSATNLVAGGTAPGVTHVYLRDRDVSNSGTFDTPGNTATVLVDVAAGTAGDASASQAVISADGQLVAFASRATNLAPAPTTAGRQHIYVRDVTAGTTSLVSVGIGGAESSADSRNPSINRNAGVAAGVGADGRYIAFGSDASNLVAGDTNAVSDVFVYDRVAATTTRVSVSSAGAQAIDPTVTSVTGSRLGSLNPTVSATGRYVAFVSLANNLAPGDTVGRYSPTGSGNGALNVYVMDRDADADDAYDEAGSIATSLVSVNRFGYQSYYILSVQSTAAADIFPVISADGRWVAFPFDAEGSAGLIHTTTNLISQDSNSARDVLIFDRRTNSLPSAATPPVVSITNPGNGGTALVNTPITVTASATTTAGVVASVQFFVNGTALGTSTVFPYSAQWTPTAVGNYTLSALVTDSFGNIGVSSNIAVTVNAAPSVGITFPTSTTAITSGSVQTVTASAGASNPGATIVSVQFFVDGRSLGAADTTAPYSASWTPPAAGTFTLTAVATDSVGTQTNSPPVTVTVTAVGGGGGGGGGGTPPPTVSITTPAGGATLAVNTSTLVSATAAATGGNVRSVQFFANGSSIGTATTFPFSVQWTPLTPGAYALTATAIDHLGVQSTSVPTSVTVTAGSAPTVTLVSPLTGGTVAVGSSQTLVANASAGSAQIANVQFFVNGISLGTDTSFPYNLTWTPSGVGPAVLTAIATDQIGNQAVSPAVSLTVATVSATTPVVTITSPAAGSSLPVGSASTLSATAADPDGTIATVQFFANGVAVGSPDTSFPYSVEFTPTSPGNYVITAQAIDNGGNIANSSPVSVNVAGGVAPTIAITSPAGGTTVPVNAPQTLTANAASPGGVITSVQFFVNGLAIGSADTTFPYSTTWTPLGLGTYSISARATDNVGNITDSAAIVVTAAGSAGPTVSVTNPTAGSSYTVGTALTLSATAADADGTIGQVQFFVNGLPQGSPDTAAPYATTWTAQSAGVYALTAQATDNTGNVTTSTPVSVTIGANSAPTVSITSPAIGLSYSLGNQVLVAATATDADGSIASVQFFANGLSLGSSTAMPFLTSWRPTVAGNYTLTAIATDNAGNVTVSAPVAVTVSSSGAPSVVVTNPAAGSSFVVGNAIPFVATASGGNGPIAQVQFFVNGAPLGTADTTSPYTSTWTPTAPGSYSLLAVATDSVGISSNSTALTVTIGGNLPPTASITSPPSGTSVTAGTLVNLTATSTDADGTVASVRFLANGNTVATATAAPFIGAWTPSAPGSYTIVAQAQDNSGNVTNSTAITVTVQANQPPVVALTAPGNGAAVRIGAAITISANAADADGTVASVQFFANGSSVAAADATAPYSATFTPPAEGVYRITAVALDNSGAATTSATATIVVVAATADDKIYSGTFAGLGESGRFAAVVVRGKTASFIGFSGTGSSRQVYFHPSLSVDAGRRSGGVRRRGTGHNLRYGQRLRPDRDPGKRPADLHRNGVFQCGQGHRAGRLLRR